MSERGRTIQGAQTSPEGHSTLGELSASRDLHKTTSAAPSTEPANQSDLTSLSLSPSNVVRVPHRPEPRRNVSTKPSFFSERETSTTRLTRSSKHSSGEPAHGIITNPTYKYTGGLVSKIISFIANILKVLERLLLRLLIGPDKAAPTTRQQTKPATTSEKEASRQDSAKQERERRERAQTIARS
jgi:hypothetical protein